MNMAKSTGPYMNPNYPKDVFVNLPKYREDELFTDVTLKVQGSLFPCHRAVLSAGSSYFQSMFTSGMKECQENVIDLKDVDPKAFRVLLDFIYSGSLDIKLVSPKSVGQILMVSDQFLVSGLKNLCEKYILNNLAESFNDQLLSLFGVSVSYRLDKLNEKVVELLREKLVENVHKASPEDLMLSQEEQLIQILQDSNMKSETEDIFYELLQKWVGALMQDRCTRFPHVLQYVRLPYCSSHFLEDVVAKDPLMADPECHKLLEEARYFQKDVAHQHEMVNPRTERRVSYKKREILMIDDGDRGKFGAWLLKTNSHDNIVPPVGEVGGFRADNALCHIAVSGHYIVVTGGLERGGSLEDASRQALLFFIDKDKDGEIRRLDSISLQTGRYQHCSVIINDTVYVIGGQSYDSERKCFTPPKSTEHLKLEKDPSGNAKLTHQGVLPGMPYNRTNALAVAFGSKIYVISGDKTEVYEDEDENLTSTFEFDTVQKSWSVKADMPLASWRPAAVRYNNNIYVIGGRHRTCLCYTPDSDTWTTLTGPASEHIGGTAVVWNGKIVLAGGNIHSEEFFDRHMNECVEEYDPATDTWTTYDDEIKVPFVMGKCLMFNIPAIVVSYYDDEPLRARLLEYMKQYNKDI